MSEIKKLEEMTKDELIAFSKAKIQEKEELTKKVSSHAVVRLTSTSVSKNFHLAVNRLFTAEDFKEIFKDDLVEITEEIEENKYKIITKECFVFKAETKEKVFAYIKDKCALKH